MKTLTITYHSAVSYGAVLQAYGLQKFLINIEISNEIIDVYAGGETERFSVFMKNKGISSIIKNISKLTHYYEYLRGRNKFSEFISNDMAKTKRYFSFAELYQNPPLADTYICGSDQIWNVKNGIKKAYFLDFVAKDTKRVSYAASIGINYIPEAQKEQVKYLLANINDISVREENAKRILQPLTDKPIEVNIDPTFLPTKEDWRQMAKPVSGIKKPYILCYMIYRPVWLNDQLCMLHKSTGLDIILIDYTGFRNIYNNKIIRDAGPCEFLWLIDNADKVVTSSFHGTTFSVIFEKDFYSIVNPSSPDRICDLLENLHLENHIIDNLSAQSIPSDWATAKQMIEFERSKSEKYLKKVIV